jgi:adenylate kinase
VVKVAGVFGLSGVGKSWLISRYSGAHTVLHVQASQLLRDAKAAISGAVVTSEELRTGAVLDNQQLLIRAFATAGANAGAPIIFDGHCLIDSGNQLIAIPSEVIEALSVSGLVFVRSDASEIVARRRSDTARIRPLRSVEEISLHQQRAYFLCQGYAIRLNLNLHIVHAGDEKGFESAVNSIFDRCATRRIPRSPRLPTPKIG